MAIHYPRCPIEAAFRSFFDKILLTHPRHQMNLHATDRIPQSLSKDGSIVGLYAGWLHPQTERWQPILELRRSTTGYHIYPTSNYLAIAKEYRGMPEILGLSDIKEEYIYSSIPSIFSDRIPTVREDIGELCQLLSLEFPDIDPFAFMSRTGGKINGDPFSICPILNPNTDGNYEFYCCIGTPPELKKCWDKFTIGSKLECQDGETFVRVDGDKYRIVMPEFFSQLQGSIVEGEIINISEPSVFGRRAFAKIVIASTSPYSSSTFSRLQLAKV